MYVMITTLLFGVEGFRQYPRSVFGVLGLSGTRGQSERLGVSRLRLGIGRSPGLSLVASIFFGSGKPEDSQGWSPRGSLGSIS